MSRPPSTLPVGLHRGLATRIQSTVVSCLLAAALTYSSLAVPGSVSAPCGNLGSPVDCTVLAYGFPLPFIADSQALSPVGSVARDPLSLVVGEDDVLWPRLALSTLFWMLVVAAGKIAWRRWTQRSNGGWNAR